MLGDRLFLPHLGCAVTMVNPSCRFTKSAKWICPGFQDARHPDLHSSSDQAFCHSEVPDKRLMRACSLPAPGIFSEHAGSGMRLTSEACAGHQHMVSQPPPHAARWTSPNTYVHTHAPLSRPQCLGTPGQEDHAYELPVACGKDLVAQPLLYTLPIHPAPLPFL